MRSLFVEVDEKKGALGATEKMLRLRAQTKTYFYSIFHASDRHLMNPASNAVSRRGASFAFGSSARSNGSAQGIHTCPDAIQP
jgi:hypothetical protein